MGVKRLVFVAFTGSGSAHKSSIKPKGAIKGKMIVTNNQPTARLPIARNEMDYKSINLSGALSGASR